MTLIWDREKRVGWGQR